MRYLILYIALQFSCVCLCAASGAGGIPTDTLTKVAEVVLAWDGGRPGDLYSAVKRANPDAPAIVSLRELNKAIDSGGMPAVVMSRARQLATKQSQAVSMVRNRVWEVRKASLSTFWRNNPEKVRSLYGIGDIGSWPDKATPDASMDIDWTIFGTDPRITGELRDACVADLVMDLVGRESGLGLADFDVVITAEGHEVQAGVFESQGGIDWAKRNMKCATVMQPDGASRLVVLGSGDPVAELVYAENMSRLRDLATQRGDYDKLFDNRGFLRTALFDDPANNSAQELWNVYMDRLSKVGVDFYRTTASTATGGCLDMAKHLHEEVLTKKFEPVAKLKKMLKYVARGNNISRGVSGLRDLLAQDVLLQDPAYKDVVALALEVQQANEARVAGILRERFGDTPDAALEELGSKARRTLLRMAELAYQFEMDRIVLDVADKGERQGALDRLAGDMHIIAGEGGDYSDLARTALDHIARLTEANDSGTLEVLREHYVSLDKIRRTEPETRLRATEFLQQTELGRKMLDVGGKVLELGMTRIELLEAPRFRSATVDYMDAMLTGARSKGLAVMDYAGSLSMWTEVLDNVRTSRNDAELAIALGRTLVNNTFFGMVLNSAYAGIVQGSNEALAKAVMYMLVPETAIGALVESLGNTAITLTAQTLFDAQLEQAYQACSFDKQGAILDFSGLGAPGVQGAGDFVAILCDGTPEMVAYDFVDRSKASNFAHGANIMAIKAMAKAVRSTVDNGNPLVFTEDGPLMRACAAIRKITEDINDCARIWGVEVSLAASNSGDLPAGLDMGQARAFLTLLEQRGKSRSLARQAIAEALVRTFEERCRAERSLDGTQALAEYQELLRQFRDLAIEEKGGLSLEEEKGFNVISGVAMSDREKEVSAVKAVQKFKDAYSFVLQCRRVAEEAFQRVMGRSPMPRPLTGSLPLTAKPELDVQLAQAYLKEIAGLGASLAKELEHIKASPLAGAYDEETLRKLFDAHFKRAHWAGMMRSASKAQSLHWALEIVDKQALYEAHAEAAAESGKASDAIASILEEYRRHYELPGELMISLTAPESVYSGEKADLLCRVSLASSGKEKGALPEDFSRQLTYRWKAGSVVLGESATAQRSYTLSTVGEHGFEVTVLRAVLEGGELVNKPLGTQTVTVRVLPVQEAEAAPATKKRPGSDVADKKTAIEKKQPAVPKPNTHADSETKASSAASGQTQPAERDLKWFKAGLRGGWTTEHNKVLYWAAKMSREISGKSENCRPQTVRGTVVAKLERSFLPKPTEIDAKLRGYVEGNGWYPQEEGIESIAIGPYKGRLLTTTVKYKEGFGNPMAGYRDGTAHAFGHMIVLHETERLMINANFSVSAGSCWNNSGKVNALTQVKAVRAQALAILRSLSLHATEQKSAVQEMAEADYVEPFVEKKTPKYSLSLARVSPAAGPVFVGAPVTFKAVLVGGKPEGELRFQFEPHPAVAYSPVEGPSASTTAVFSVPGRVGVWVTAMDKTGTIATSDQVEIEVLRPSLELVLEPKAPLVGQEVKARLQVKPEVREIDFRWLPVPGNAKHVATSKDNREIRFYLKDEKPADIQVLARVPFSGEDLGEAKVRIKASRYTVSVSEPRVYGVTPRVWKEGLGLVNVEKAIAVHQILEFSAEVKPAVSSGPVKYAWRVESGACSIANSITATPRVTASAPGPCVISVTVRDRNDVELGRGQGGFTAMATEAPGPKAKTKPQADAAAYGWVLTGSEVVRGKALAGTQGAEASVGLTEFSSELIVACPHGRGAGGSKDPNNPQRLHARYTWSVPKTILPGGKLVVPIKQQVLSAKTGNYGTRLTVAVSIGDTWSLNGRTEDGKVVKPYELGIGWGGPDWMQKNLLVTYEREWLWNTGNPSDKKLVSITFGGIGNHKVVYCYEWRRIP